MKDPAGRAAAGVKSAATKGEAELRRAALMAAWTRLNGKNDAANPYAKANFNSQPPALAPNAPLPPPADLAAVDDARLRMMQSIVAREGQGAFRGAVVAAYGGRCAITGCTEVQALEAAHIRPYLGVHTNGVTNGLLLRADLHTLFDKGLLSFEIGSGPPVVVMAPTIIDPEYRALHAVPLRMPEDPAKMPNQAALMEHRNSCRW